jgi:hypothetical protein
MSTNPNPPPTQAQIDDMLLKLHNLHLLILANGNQGLADALAALEAALAVMGYQITL